jgi:hypothetical protein
MRLLQLYESAKEAALAALVCVGVARQLVAVAIGRLVLPHRQGRIMLCSTARATTMCVVRDHKHLHPYASPPSLLIPPPPSMQARVCSGGSHLTIRISDQGGGIPQEHLSQVRPAHGTAPAHVDVSAMVLCIRNLHPPSCCEP